MKAPRKRHPNVSGFPRTGESVTEAVKRAAARSGSVTETEIRPGRRRESVTQTGIPRRRGCITSPKRRSRRQSARNVSPKRRCPPAAEAQPSPKRGSRLHGGKKRYRNVDAAHGDDGKRYRNTYVVYGDSGKRYRKEDPAAGRRKSVTEARKSRRGEEGSVIETQMSFSQQ